MNIWQCKDWSKYIDTNYEYYRSGLRLRFEQGVDPEVKRACKEFCNWLRQNYIFPIRVPIYFKASECVFSQSGEKVSANFFGPYDKKLEPYVRIATGDYLELEQKLGRDDALAAVLGSIVHELTHYFQWIKNLDFTERQALYYKNKIVYSDYAQTREHP